MGKILKYTTIFLLIFSAGCNSWLEVVPEDQRVSEDYWSTKEDVKNTTIAGYVTLRECLLEMIQWGELRGDALELTPPLEEEEESEEDDDNNKKDDDDRHDEQNIRSMNISSTNKVVKWDDFYKVINTANSVIDNAESVLSEDQTFEREECAALISENIFIRSLCYFYLVRSFGEVPLILKPFLTDEQDYQQGKVSEQTIINTLIQDLEAALPTASREFSSTPVDRWQNTARATRWAILALLADIYLWDGQYEKAEKSCNLLIESNRFRLVDKEDWFLNYYPGSTDEIIFQLHFDQALKQDNDMDKWFGGDGERRYIISENLTDQYEDMDVRGEGGTYNGSNYIWKYLGTALGGDKTRGNKEKSPHWICYRYADILLMKAEALVMKAGESDSTYVNAMTLVNMVRGRAGATELTGDDLIDISQADFLRDIILKERKKEFVAEGKYWYDVLRIGKRDNYKHEKMMVEILLEDVSALYVQIHRTKLSKRNSHFFPIHYDDIVSSGGVLLQNSYYSNNN